MKARRLLCVSVVLSIALSGCKRGGTASEAANELPTLDVTHWTDKTELFMEYPVLVSGQKSLFAVHLTRLNDFAPVNEGRARVEFTPESGGATRFAHRSAAFTARRVSRRRGGAGSRSLSLGAGARVARPLGST